MSHITPHVHYHLMFINLQDYSMPLNFCTSSVMIMPPFLVSNNHSTHDVPSKALLSGPHNCNKSKIKVK